MANTVLTSETVDCIRRIGRDEEGRRKTIGLAELDGLCDSHERLRVLVLAAAVAIDTSPILTEFEMAFLKAAADALGDGYLTQEPGPGTAPRQVVWTYEVEDVKYGPEYGDSSYVLGVFTDVESAKRVGLTGFGKASWTLVNDVWQATVQDPDDVRRVRKLYLIPREVE